MPIFDSSRGLEKRGKVVGVRMSEREFFVLKKLAKRHRSSPSNVIRKALKILFKDSHVK